MTIDALNKQVDKQRGKSGGWPSELTYSASEGANIVEVTISVADKAKGGVWKKINYINQVLAFGQELFLCLLAVGDVCPYTKEVFLAIQCGHPASKIIGYLVPVFGQERGFGVRFPL